MRKSQPLRFFLISNITLILLISTLLIPVTANIEQNSTARTRINQCNHEVTAYQAENMRTHNNDLVFVDIRPIEEFLKQRIHGALSAPLEALSCDSCLYNLLSDFQEQQIIIYDQDGTLSKDGYQLLKNQGFDQVFTLYGGIAAWVQLGYAIASDQTMTMDAMTTYLEDPYTDDYVHSEIPVDDDCIISTWDGGTRIDPGCMWAEFIEHNDDSDTYGIYLNITGPNGDNPVTFTHSSIYFFKRLDQGATDNPGDNFPNFEYVLDPNAGLGYPVILPGYDHSLDEPTLTGYFEKQTISHSHPITINPGDKTLVATFNVDHTDDFYGGPYFTYGYIANFNQGGNPWLNSIAYQDGFNNVDIQTIDINRDGILGDLGDLGLLLSCYYSIGNQVRYVPPADLNNDYMVNMQDLGIYIAEVNGTLPDDDGDDGDDGYDPYPDTVIGYYKVSDTEGGFTYPLEQYCMFGHSLANIGDIDGDGIDDLAVGKPSGDDDGGQPSSGSIFILFMNDDGTVRCHQKISNSEGNFNANLPSIAHFGWAVEPLGDIDNDGVPDIAVGAPNMKRYDVTVGAVFLLHLTRDGTVKTYTELTNGQNGLTSNFLDENDNFGWALTNMGDIDGNGHVDLLIGAPGDDDGHAGNGAVYTLFLETNPDGNLQVNRYQKISATHGGFDGDLSDMGYHGYYVMAPAFGSSVAALHDMNGDGVREVAIGAFGDDGTNICDVGAVFILFMNADGTVQHSQKISAGMGGMQAMFGTTSWFGYSVAPIGDLDSDGVQDLAVGMILDDDNDDGYDSTNTGAIWLLYLNPDGTVKSYRKISDTKGGDLVPDLDESDHFGTSLELVRDYNNDGIHDLAVGAHFDDDGGKAHGAFYILFLNHPK